MQTTDPVLFACYILFVYFNGQNIARIEREMRSLGYTRFHRRILYPRVDKPGWIAKYNWTGAVGVPPTMSPKGESRAGKRASPLAPTIRQPENRAAQSGLAGGTPAAPVAPPASKIPHSAVRGPQFKDWLRTVSPNMTWSWRHQQVIIEQLERVTRGECKRLMIFLPPRHGKSELVTVRYTAWRMQRDPAMSVILGSYNQRLADRFSRKIRKVIADAEAIDTSAVGGGQLATADAAGNAAAPGCMSAKHEKNGGQLPDRQSTTPPTANCQPPTANASPFPFISSKPANSVSEWETTAGGGFRSVGVGSGVTGFGASLIVIDDPIKSRAEAESETYRERVWDWFTDDLYTRLEPDGAVVLIQTRWHDDDLAGRLLREASEEGGEQWDVVNLPALSEPPVVTGGSLLSEPPVVTGGSPKACADNEFTKPNPNASGNPPLTSGGSDWRDAPDLPLCPERFDLTALKRIRQRLGEYSFAALYQQRPTPAEGGLFKREWFKKIIPFAPPGLKWKRGYDLAVSTKTNADYTASFRCAFDKEGNLYISGGFRARLEYPDQRRLVIDRIKAEPDTEHGIELALHGQALIQDLRRERGLRGHLLRGVRVEHDKYTRALTWAPLAEEGKIFLVRTADCGLRNPAPGGNASVNERGDRGPGHPTTPQAALRIPQSWISDFLDEVCSFPSAAHDDQVDAVSLAVQMLKGSGKRSCGF